MAHFPPIPALPRPSRPRQTCPPTWRILPAVWPPCRKPSGQASWPPSRRPSLQRWTGGTSETGKTSTLSAWPCGPPGPPGGNHSGHRGDGQGWRQGPRLATRPDGMSHYDTQRGRKKGRERGQAEWPTNLRRCGCGGARPCGRTARLAGHGPCGATRANCARLTRGGTIRDRCLRSAFSMTGRPTSRPAPAPPMPGLTGPAVAFAAGPTRPCTVAPRRLPRTSPAAGGHHAT